MEGWKIQNANGFLWLMECNRAGVMVQHLTSLHEPPSLFLTSLNVQSSPDVLLLQF